MPRFEYLEPQTLSEAIAMLQQHGDSARIVAGSTDFLIRSRQGVWRPDFVVNLQHIPGLDTLSYNPDDGLSIGAMVTVQALERDPAVREHYPALATGATSFAGVQVRNLATVGGNVCNASPAGDTLPALLALQAECRIAGPQGERRVALDQFFTGPGRTVLQPGEILTEFRFPPPAPSSGSLYIKHSPRGAMDIASVGVASAVTLQDGGGVCQEARIALGAVAPTPFRAYSAEDMLRGQEITPSLIESVAREAENLARPIDDVRNSAAYRKAIAGALTRRTLENAIQMARTGSMSFEVQRRLAVQTAF
jgi:carbon-monoxide dehydrogenase medium subunit